MQVETVSGAQAPLAAIGRLRYEVYIAELGKAYADADHAGRMLLDELDPVSTHFVVHRSGGRLIAALRYTPLDGAGRRRLAVEGLGELACDEELLARSSLSSRLVLDRSVRGALRELPAMVEAIYTHGSLAGSLLNFLHCQPRLVPLFARIGFRRVAPDFAFSPTGRTHSRVCLQTDAIGPLEAVGSHLAHACRRLFDVSQPPRSDLLLARANLLLNAGAPPTERAA